MGPVGTGDWGLGLELDNYNLPIIKRVPSPAQQQLALLRVVDEALGLLSLQGGLAEKKEKIMKERDSED